MILYYSGGSPIAETEIKDPAIMPSFYVVVKNGKPNSRMRDLMEIRKKAKSESKKKGKK